MKEFEGTKFHANVTEQRTLAREGMHVLYAE